MKRELLENSARQLVAPAMGTRKGDVSSGDFEERVAQQYQSTARKPWIAWRIRVDDDAHEFEWHQVSAEEWVATAIVHGNLCMLTGSRIPPSRVGLESADPNLIFPVR